MSERHPPAHCTIRCVDGPTISPSAAVRICPRARVARLDLCGLAVRPHASSLRIGTRFVSFSADLRKESPEFGSLAEILASIVSSRRADDLAVTTSMHDPVITPRPVPEPPLDVVIVRAPNSLRNGPRPGHVVIEEMPLTGHGDLIERPAAEAVPLFWRFMIEKYGVHPSR